MITTWLRNKKAPVSWRTLFVDDKPIPPERAHLASVRLKNPTNIPSQLHRDVLDMRDHVWNQITPSIRSSYHKNIFFAVLSKVQIRNQAGVWHRNLPAGNYFEGSLRAIYYISTQAGSSIQFSHRTNTSNENNGVPRQQNKVCVGEVVTAPGTIVFFEDSRCYHRVASNGTRHLADDQRIFISFTFLPKPNSVIRKKSK